MAQFFFYFGLKRVMEQLFEDKDFVRARANSATRSYDDPSTFFGSKEFKRMNDFLQGALREEDVSTYSLGFDFVQSFVFKNHSVGLLVLRCEDLSPEDKVLRKWHVPLMIIPGPRDPPVWPNTCSLSLKTFARLRRLQSVMGKAFSLSLQLALPSGTILC